jgi:hypothetical protein
VCRRETAPSSRAGVWVSSTLGFRTLVEPFELKQQWEANARSKRYGDTAADRPF